eukprot:Rhum_TRINITY_DN11149_c1_g1::Rhum_TRINITY_DN11149_c1_g1_i1::g.42900::m.42900
MRCFLGGDRYRRSGCRRVSALNRMTGQKRVGGGGWVEGGVGERGSKSGTKSTDTNHKWARPRLLSCFFFSSFILYLLLLSSAYCCSCWLFAVCWCFSLVLQSLGCFFFFVFFPSFFYHKIRALCTRGDASLRGNSVRVAGTFTRFGNVPLRLFPRRGPDGVAAADATADTGPADTGVAVLLVGSVDSDDPKGSDLSSDDTIDACLCAPPFPACGGLSEAVPSEKNSRSSLTVPCDSVSRRFTFIVRGLKPPPPLPPPPDPFVCRCGEDTDRGDPPSPAACRSGLTPGAPPPALPPLHDGSAVDPAMRRLGDDTSDPAKAGTTLMALRTSSSSSSTLGSVLNDGRRAKLSLGAHRFDSVFVEGYARFSNGLAGSRSLPPPLAAAAVGAAFAPPPPPPSPLARRASGSGKADFTTPAAAAAAGQPPVLPLADVGEAAEPEEAAVGAAAVVGRWRTEAEAGTLSTGEEGEEVRSRSEGGCCCCGEAEAAAAAAA